MLFAIKKMIFPERNPEAQRHWDPVFGTIHFVFTAAEFCHIGQYVILYSGILRVKFTSFNELL